MFTLNEKGKLGRLTEEDKKSMAPLFMFLNSSLNTELVYIILKSITSFGVHHKQDSQVSVAVDQENGDGKLKLTKIKIKNYDSWSRQSDLAHG